MVKSDNDFQDYSKGSDILVSLPLAFCYGVVTTPVGLLQRFFNGVKFLLQSFWAIVTHLSMTYLCLVVEPVGGFATV